MIFLVGKAFSQTDKLYYEQKAFDLYQNEILDSFPVNKKIKIYQHAFDFHPKAFRFSIPNCLENIVWKNNEQFEEMTTYKERKIDFDSSLDFSKINKKQFKIKINGKGNFPKLLISSPHIEKGNNKRIFINLYEKHSERKEYIYHIEFNINGKIINWCRSEYYEIIIH